MITQISYGQVRCQGAKRSKGLMEVWLCGFTQVCSFECIRRRGAINAAWITIGENIKFSAEETRLLRMEGA